MQAIDTCDPVDYLSGAVGKRAAIITSRVRWSSAIRRSPALGAGDRRQVEAVVGGHRARAGVVVHRAAVGGVVQHAPPARREDHAAGEDPRGDGRLHNLTHLEEDISEGYARITVLASTRGNTSW